MIVVLVAKAYGMVRPRIDFAAWRATLTEGFPLLIYGICRATILTIDIVLIALILGHGETGLYGAALKPVAFFLGALGLFSVSFLSGLQRCTLGRGDGCSSVARCSCFGSCR